MSTLCIDIETYSDADIKLGVHKYVDSHNFRVLLLAYAFDSEPVEVVDLPAVSRYQSSSWRRSMI